MMDAPQVLQYYREHSAFTDPGKYASLTTQVDNAFEDLRALFAQTAYGQAVREQIAVLV